MTPSTTAAPTFTTRPEIQGHHGMVSSTHYLGSATGMAMLEQGGNAADAAVAAGFVMQVVEPHLAGPGGDLSLLFAPRGAAPIVLCGQGPAPAAATVEAFTDLGLAEIPGSGLLAATVPGATLGWLTLLRDHGTMNLAQVLSEAIGYAETGFPVLPSMTTSVTAVADLLRTEWPTTAAHYLGNGGPVQPGDRLTNPALAATYRRLVEVGEGRDREAGIDAAIAEWREGFVAETIDAFFRSEAMDSSGERHAGLLTGNDLAGWQPSYEQPVMGEFAGHRVAKGGPWSQGPVLLQQLAMLDGIDLEPDSAEFVHTVIEGAKLALADRNAHYGDSAEVPLGALLAADYTAARRAQIGPDASGELRAGAPGGQDPNMPSYPDLEGDGTAAALRESTVPHPGVWSAAQHPEVPPAEELTGWYDGPIGEPDAGPYSDEQHAADTSGAATPPAVSHTDPHTTGDGRTRGDTCHIDVVDRWGNMVSATPSGGWLQSSPLIPTLGFPLGTRLQMMTLQPNLPTTLKPGRRPRTTLSPGMVLAGDEAVLAFGTPGGDQQDQWTVPFLLRYLRHGYGLQQAIDAPAFHTTHVPSSFYPHEAHPRQVLIEDRFDESVLAELRRRGHELEICEPWSLGRLSAVARDPGTGVLRAAADARGMQGYAVGR